MTRAIASAAVALLALPGVVAGVVPLVIVRLQDGDRAFHPAGFAGLVPGLLLLGWCVREIFVAGRGTLAPWDPPRHLVTSGPYRYSRHPMYLAVGLVLLGWAIGFQTVWLWIYVAVALVGFHIRVRGAEEPRLARAFRDEWTRYAARVPRWIGRPRAPAAARPRSAPPQHGRQAAIGALAVLLVAATAGLVYEAFAEGRDARAFPPPGEHVDIGGRSLHLVCLGDGVPAVIVEADPWGTALDAREMRERVAARTRVCSYDARGRGWSDPAPGAATVADLATDLAVLQDRAPLRGPFVLVAPSIGGLTIELLARQFPERVAGLVFLDAASSESLPLVATQAASVAAPACRHRTLAYLGVTRLLDPLRLGEASEEDRRHRAVHYSAAAWGGLCARARGLRDSVALFDDAPPLDPELPIAVLSAASGDDRALGRLAWITGAMHPALVESHERLAARSAHGTWERVPDAGHRLADDQPEVVADAVLAIVDRARATGPRTAREQP